MEIYLKLFEATQMKRLGLDMEGEDRKAFHVCVDFVMSSGNNNSFMKDVHEI